MSFPIELQRNTTHRWREIGVEVGDYDLVDKLDYADACLREDSMQVVKSHKQLKRQSALNIICAFVLGIMIGGAIVGMSYERRLRPRMRSIKPKLEIAGP